VSPLVDEIVVVDTGSTDATRRIARARGARLYSFTWADDFAAARNHGVARARGRWILYIDADEWMRPADAARLRSYSWPGNVRELQNVIERAVITAIGGRLNLDRALPELPSETRAAAPAVDRDTARIRTLQELETLERDNLCRALEAAQWRVSGEQGAAALLGMNPSTLRSRMKALGIKSPV